MLAVIPKLSILCNDVVVLMNVRYKKRERGKLVHTYSAKDLDGILVSA